MSYGLNIEMHKQVSYLFFFVTILNDSNTIHFRKKYAVLFSTFLWLPIFKDCVLERMLFFSGVVPYLFCMLF